MATALVITAVALVAFAAGYQTGIAPLRAFGVWIGGLVLILAVFLGESVLRYPTGESWADRTTVLGHWVPDWQWIAGVWSVLAWCLAVWAGWLIRWTALEWPRHRAR